MNGEEEQVIVDYCSIPRAVFASFSSGYCILA